MPTRFRSSLPARPRSASLVAVLVITVALAGVLAYEAWDAARSHRATAERTLRDYASFAAWEFSVSVKEFMYDSLSKVFSPVSREQLSKPGAVLEQPGVIAHQMTGDWAGPSPYYFRLDIPSNHLVIDGTAPTAEVQRWIRDTVAADVAGIYKRDWTYSTVCKATVNEEPYTIVYQVKWRTDGTPAAAYGFRLRLSTFANPGFFKVMNTARLLPPTLTGQTPNDSILSVLVFDGVGHDLWQSPRQYPRDFEAESRLPYFGGFETRVAINPEFASRLVIGGLPKSRLPLLLGLLALSTLIAAMGVMQLRREDELTRLRADFVTSVSHELRTPLAQVRMFAETLLLGRVRSEEERHRSLVIVNQEARRLSQLVENVLHFSRAERQRVQLQPVDDFITPQLNDAVELFAPIASARGSTVVTHVDETVRAPADADGLRQMVLNLLDNAIKYGPVGQEVRVTLTHAGRAARIFVDDQGPGIPADQRERIWKPFHRLERDANSSVAGSGIGLSVVRDLATRHGGRAWVEDIPGGARFVIELPMATVEARA